MLDGPWLLLLLAILAGGAIAATLMAAFGTRSGKEDRESGRGDWESPEEEGSGVESDFARLAETETRIEKLTTLSNSPAEAPSTKRRYSGANESSSPTSWISRTSAQPSS